MIPICVLFSYSIDFHTHFPSTFISLNCLYFPHITILSPYPSSPLPLTAIYPFSLLLPPYTYLPLPSSPSLHLSTPHLLSLPSPISPLTSSPSPLLPPYTCLPPSPPLPSYTYLPLTSSPSLHLSPHHLLSLPTPIYPLTSSPSLHLSPPVTSSPSLHISPPSPPLPPYTYLPPPILSLPTPVSPLHHLSHPQLYYETTLTNLLQVLMFHSEAVLQSTDYIIDVIDFVGRKLTWVGVLSC